MRHNKSLISILKEGEGHFGGTPPRRHLHEFQKLSKTKASCAEEANKSILIFLIVANFTVLETGDLQEVDG